MRSIAVLAGALVLLSASTGGVGHAASPSRSAMDPERSLDPRKVVAWTRRRGRRASSRDWTPRSRPPSADRPDEVVRSYLRDDRDTFRLDDSEIANVEIVRRSPSRYRATFIAQDAAGNRSTPRTIGFRLVRR